MITALSQYLVEAMSILTLHDSLTSQWVGLILIPLIGTLARE
jgi:hypothetical protein